MDRKLARTNAENIAERKTTRDLGIYRHTCSSRGKRKKATKPREGSLIPNAKSHGAGLGDRIHKLQGKENEEIFPTQLLTSIPDIPPLGTYSICSHFTQSC